MKMYGRIPQTSWNWRITTSVPVRTAPRALKNQEFSSDLIICDIMMPGLDGYQVLEALQANIKTAGIPFVFLSAKADKSDVRKGMNLGADDYLTKPFEEHELLEATDSRLKRHEFLQKEYSRDISGLNAFMEQAAAFLNLDHIERVYYSKTYEPKELLYMGGQMRQTSCITRQKRTG